MRKQVNSNEKVCLKGVPLLEIRSLLGLMIGLYRSFDQFRCSGERHINVDDAIARLSANPGDRCVSTGLTEHEVSPLGAIGVRLSKATLLRRFGRTIHLASGLILIEPLVQGVVPLRLRHEKGQVHLEVRFLRAVKLRHEIPAISLIGV